MNGVLLESVLVIARTNMAMYAVTDPAVVMLSRICWGSNCGRDGALLAREPPIASGVCMGMLLRSV